MGIMLESIAFAIAAACAAVMGFAIQRGATCTVAAVDEVVGKRGFARLVSMFEASVWVAGGLLIRPLLAAGASGSAAGRVTGTGGASIPLAAETGGSPTPLAAETGGSLTPLAVETGGSLTPLAVETGGSLTPLAVETGGSWGP